MILKVIVNNNTESAVNINQDSSFLISSKNDGYTIFHNNHDILPDAVWFWNKAKASDMLESFLKDYRDHKFEYILDINWLIDSNRGLIVKGYNDSKSIEQNKEKPKLYNPIEDLLDDLEELFPKESVNDLDEIFPKKPVPKKRSMLDEVNEKVLRMKKEMWENSQKRRNNGK